MNGFIGIKTNWYTKVKKHLHVSKQLNYISLHTKLDYTPHTKRTNRKSIFS